MSTWILTEKLEKLLLKHGKSNQEIAKEMIFVLVLMYSSTLGSYDWVVSVGYLKDDQFQKTLPRYCRDLNRFLTIKPKHWQMNSL
jgi:hypothetical protein